MTHPVLLGIALVNHVMRVAHAYTHFFIDDCAVITYGATSAITPSVPRRRSVASPEHAAMSTRPLGWVGWRSCPTSGPIDTCQPLALGSTTPPQKESQASRRITDVLTHHAANQTRNKQPEVDVTETVQRAPDTWLSTSNSQR